MDIKQTEIADKEAGKNAKIPPNIQTRSKQFLEMLNDNLKPEKIRLGNSSGSNYLFWGGKNMRKSGPEGRNPPHKQNLNLNLALKAKFQDGLEQLDPDMATLQTTMRDLDMKVATEGHSYTCLVVQTPNAQSHRDKITLKSDPDGYPI